MIYALDTNIISYLLRRAQNPDVVYRFETEVRVKKNYYVIPPVALYEVAWYLLRKNAGAQTLFFRELYDGALMRAGMSEDAFWLAARIRVDLAQHGQLIDANDVLIAAFCIVNDFVLVTNNLKHFERIDVLQCVNWKA